MDRNIPLENITYYFDSISSMGFRSILFDDAWQNVVRFEVDEEGMWDPSDITVVTQFMERAREAKMKVALWYAQPFLGAHTKVFQKFDGKYLQYRTSSQPSLDIRYPEVREYLTKMYTDIVTEWKVDGIWFNFLNGYYPNEHIIITDDDGRDYVSVRKALDSLRTLMEYEMLYANPELSINQSYPAVGPLHTSNTRSINGFLGTTALQEVREKMVNNRLLYGEYSPFMEVMGIHPKDPSVDLAKKFQSIIFATPYVSYFSYTLPDDLQKTLRFWIRYWKNNADYLLFSDFKAYNPIQRYPVIWAGNQTKNILVFYDRVEPFDFGYFSFEQADVINSSNYPMVSVKGTPTGKVDFITYDHRGDYVNRGSLNFKREIAQIEIPIGGYARLIVK
jgi:alpha-galactosidase